MSIKLQDDILNATWGDTRSGRLNIWYQRMTVDGLVLTTQQISPRREVRVDVFPNPATSEVKIIGKKIKRAVIYDSNARKIRTHLVDNQGEIYLRLPENSTEVYFLQVTTAEGTITKKIFKEASVH